MMYTKQGQNRKTMMTQNFVLSLCGNITRKYAFKIKTNVLNM